MEFNIGERVRVKKYDDLPEAIKNKAMGKLCGKDGEIVDKLWSGAKGCYIYKIRFDGCGITSSVDFPTKSIDLISELDKKTYTFTLEVLDNLVLARLFEGDEESKTEIARAHGHIIHEGVVGITQAASYALKKIHQKYLENN